MKFPVRVNLTQFPSDGAWLQVVFAPVVGRVVKEG